MVFVSVDLFNPCLIGEIIMTISDAMNNARTEGSCAESMKRARLSFMRNVFKLRERTSGEQF